MHVDNEIISVADFQKKIERYQKCYEEIYYRGEVKEFLKREPSILRGKGYIENEGDLYREMMQMYSSQLSNAYSYIGKLALLQHNNVPTRLLDITPNPLIALYFACEQNGLADEEAGYVFMYIRKGKGCHSPEVYILSLHACFPNVSNEEISEKVREEFGIIYTEEQIDKIIHTPIFLKQSDDLNIGNDRIKAQDGCFFICADNENGGLKTLDEIPPVCVFRIPAMYKEAIRVELDQLGINVCSIYPEMPSGGTYLKAKYGKNVYQVTDTDYEIYEISQNTHCRRDTDLRLIVNDNLPVSSVKQIVRQVCQNYKDKSDVIWVYVGLTKEDMICHNWRITAKWINPDWKNTGIRPLKEQNGDFSWQNFSGTSVTSEFNEENVFMPEEELYVYYHHLIVVSYPLIKELFILYDGNQQTELFMWTKNNKSSVRKLFYLCTNGHRSRKKEWDDFIKHYDNLFVELDNVCAWADRKDLQAIIKWYEIGKCIQQVRIELNFILETEPTWKKTLTVSDAELSLLKPNYEKRSTYSFVQTIPINEDAIEVNMDADYYIDKDKKIVIHGNTNLFDDAELLVSVVPQGKNGGPSCKVKCKDGKFESVPLGNGEKMVGDYNIKITLSISSTQPIEFVKKAGMQYENLKGKFIVRDGFPPSGFYEKQITL